MSQIYTAMFTGLVGPTVVLSIVLPFVATANPLWQQRTANECQTILRKAGASEKFAERAGHGIHSIYVQELQKFNKNVTVNNGIPTVNPDLTNKQQIFPNAPVLKVDARFTDDALETIDWVLTNMDNPRYYMAHGGPLERIVHMFQMKKVWRIAKKTYDMIVQTPPSAEVCKCATDVENNGIMEVLRKVCAAKHRNLMETNNGISSHKPQLPDPNFKNIKTPFITSEAAWEAFKQAQFNSEFKNQDDNQYDVALFIYCQLNSPQN